MEYQEILNGNKLIAEFMGYHPTEKETGEPTYKHSEMDKGTVIWLGQFDYHKNWNSIMKVIDKIEDVATIGQRVYFGIDPFKITAYCSGVLEKELSVFSYEDSGTHFNGDDKKIKALWKAVVKTLDWYFNKRGQ